MQQAEGARAPCWNQGWVLCPEQLWRLCTAGCKPQLCSRPALSLQSAVQCRWLWAGAASGGHRSQDIFGCSSVQQSHTICASGTSAVTGSFAKLYVENFLPFYIPLHWTLPLLIGTQTLQSAFGCKVQFSNMNKAARHRVKTRKLIFLMFSVGSGSERWKKFREIYRLLCTQFTSVHNPLQPAKQLKTTTCFISCHIP